MTIEADVFRRMAVETSSVSSGNFVKSAPWDISRFTDCVYSHPVFTLLVVLLIIFVTGAIINRVRFSK